VIIFSLFDQKDGIHTRKKKKKPSSGMSNWIYLQHVGHCLKPCKEKKEEEKKN
jgi:hypothetical protein